MSLVCSHYYEILCIIITINQTETQIKVSSDWYGIEYATKFIPLITLYGNHAIQSTKGDYFWFQCCWVRMGRARNGCNNGTERKNNVKSSCGKKVVSILLYEGNDNKL